LKLPAIIDPDNEIIKHGLSSHVKYCRIIRRYLNGKRRWFVQLVLEGVPYQKEKNYVSDGLVGLDLNISSIAFVGDKKAGLLPFAENVPTFEREISALQRKMQRSQRVSNPNNYEPNFQSKVGRKTVVKKGKVKKGIEFAATKKGSLNTTPINENTKQIDQEGCLFLSGSGSGKRKWHKSNNYYASAQKKREIERRKTAYAKSRNRAVVNEILRHGNHIKTENVSVKGWQKRYGKAISAKSPGFVHFILDLAGTSDPNDYPLIVLKNSIKNGNPSWTWGGTD
jgi:putative transposase